MFKAKDSQNPDQIYTRSKTALIITELSLQTAVDKYERQNRLSY